MNNFHSVEAVDRDSETQLQASKNSNKITLWSQGESSSDSSVWGSHLSSFEEFLHRPRLIVRQLTERRGAHVEQHGVDPVLHQVVGPIREQLQFGERLVDRGGVVVNPDGGPRELHQSRLDRAVHQVYVGLHQLLEGHGNLLPDSSVLRQQQLKAGVTMLLLTLKRGDVVNKHFRAGIDCRR